ncbi:MULTISPECIES: hypothetical protein [Paenibacillus]|uniref:Uncharacterized protein n=1 Tax=Paenibacillus validus TaxID=44253 RepID=A0A7X2Z8Z3_9BACL|nr:MULTISPECIES: hypothetical protein [Paenibacillus]MUG70442.1 hypothetical protein [Paenibacillus validus]
MDIVKFKVDTHNEADRQAILRELAEHTSLTASEQEQLLQELHELEVQSGAEP